MNPNTLGLLRLHVIVSSDQALTVQVLAEYLQLWDLVDGLVLHQGVPDQY